MSLPKPPHLQETGAVHEEALYIERRADSDLAKEVKEGNLCYILGPRQLGKSSLCKRLYRQLSRNEYLPIWIDFSKLADKRDSIVDWYSGLLSEIAAQIGMQEDQFELFWARTQKLAFGQLWAKFLKDELLQRVPLRIVVFCDEIDAVRSLHFFVDAFFIIIREAYNRRASDGQYRRLSFCFIGTAVPKDLLSSDSIAEFNIGTQIRLEDFSRQEANAYEVFLNECIPKASDRKLVLDSIDRWTAGHPYMTARIVGELLRTADIQGSGAEQLRSILNTIVHKLFLNNGQNDDSSLNHTVRRLNELSTAEPHGQRPKVDVDALLRVYEMVLKDRAIVARPRDPLHEELRISGLCTWDHDLRLRCRNRISSHVFDLAWVQSQQAERELDAYVKHYLSSGKAPNTLLSGKLLLHAQMWSIGRMLSDVEKELLLASAQAEEQRRNRSWSLSILLIFVLGAASLSLGFLVLIRSMELEKREADGSTLRRELDQQKEGLRHLQAETGDRIKDQREQIASLDTKLSGQLGLGAMQARAIEATTQKEMIQKDIELLASTVQKASKKRRAELEEEIRRLRALLATRFNEEARALSEVKQKRTGWPLRHFGNVIAVATSRSRGLVATSSQPNGLYPGAVTIWNQDGTFLSEFFLPRKENEKTDANALAFSPDGMQLAAACADGELRLYRATADGSWRIERDGADLRPRPALQAVVFDPTGRYVASGGRDKQITVRSLADNKVRSLAAASEVEQLVFSPGGRLLAAAGPAPRVQIWDVSSDKPTPRGFDVAGNAACLSFPDPKTSELVAVSYTGGWEIRDAATGGSLGSGRIGEGRCLAVSKAKGSLLFAATDSNSNIPFYSAKSGTTPIHTEQLQRRPRASNAAVFSPDGQLLLAALDGYEVIQVHTRSVTPP